MITKAHSALVAEKTEIVTMGLLLTILFGATFLYCQAEEYTNGVVFSFHGDLFGSIFFLTTGFHGLHVTIGTLFLLICAVRHILTTLDRKGLRALPKRQEYKSVNVYSFQS
jgi:cytochrome c oxidase subunit 3